MLELEGVSLAYGGHEALHEVSLRLTAGETVAILGANGAGKTSLLNAIAGIARPHTGAIRFAGREIGALPVFQRVRLGIVAVPQQRHLFGPMTVAENLKMGAYSPRAREAEAARLAEVLALFPRLAERARQPVRTMSGGEQQMVAIGRALMARPALLLLDEPSLGLSPLLARELFAALGRVAATNGPAIVLVEQNAGLALRIAHRVYILAQGRIVDEGDPRTLADDDRIAAAYLGA
jgi:branched-chain amino acid transport system ATP-binding protein